MKAHHHIRDHLQGGCPHCDKVFDEAYEQAQQILAEIHEMSEKFGAIQPLAVLILAVMTAHKIDERQSFHAVIDGLWDSLDREDAEMN